MFKKINLSFEAHSKSFEGKNLDLFSKKLRWVGQLLLSTTKNSALGASSNLSMRRDVPHCFGEEPYNRVGLIFSEKVTRFKQKVPYYKRSFSHGIDTIFV